MKLTCDLCGGALQMTPGGGLAHCVNCGLEYSQERLQEKLQSAAPVTPAAPVSPAAPYVPVEQPARPRMRTLHLKRKFNLSGCAAKVAVYLDGVQCAVLGARGQADVPIAEGAHVIQVQVVGVTVTQLKPISFLVRDRDVTGTFYVKQQAFTGDWAFDITEN